MLNKKILEALNSQINKELFSSYLYLAMSTYCAGQSLGGFAKWFLLQAKEEEKHAFKIIEYIQDQKGEVKLFAISEPPTEYNSVVEIFTESVEHEKNVTASIHALYALTEQERDFATKVFLSWFVSEQVEEEAQVQNILDRVKMVGESPGGLLYLDKELGKRGEEE